MEMHAPQIIYRDISTLKESKFNPKNRLSGGRIKRLATTMARDGFWAHNPVWITDKLVIVDGHRRVHVAKSLGINPIPTIIVCEADDAARVWAESNGTRADITGRDIGEAVYMGLKHIPATRAGENTRKILELGGRDLLGQIVTSGKSPYVYEVARKTAVYCGEEFDNEFVRATIDWILEVGGTRSLIDYMKNRVPPILIVKAIQEHKKLTIKITMD